MNESRRAALADPQKTKKEARSSEESSGVTERRAREARARERARWKKRANGPLALSQTVATRPATNLEQEPRAKRREEDVQTTAFTLSSLPLYVYLLLPLLFHPCCPLFFFLSPLCFAPINNISQSPLSLSLSLSLSPRIVFQFFFFHLGFSSPPRVLRSSSSRFSACFFFFARITLAWPIR